MLSLVFVHKKWHFQTDIFHEIKIFELVFCISNNPTGRDLNGRNLFAQSTHFGILSVDFRTILGFFKVKDCTWSSFQII